MASVPDWWLVFSVGPLLNSAERGDQIQALARALERLVNEAEQLLPRAFVVECKNYISDAQSVAGEPWSPEIECLFQDMCNCASVLVAPYLLVGRSFESGLLGVWVDQGAVRSDVASGELMHFADQNPVPNTNDARFVVGDIGISARSPLEYWDTGVRVWRCQISHRHHFTVLA